eukprot:m.84102 g.84102  ORF g.84102 m.84102 type:complete len:273 (+) comp25708_c0_seq3:243-1061(+)
MFSCARIVPTATTTTAMPFEKVAMYPTSLLIEMKRPANAVWGFRVKRGCCGKVNIAKVQTGSIAQSAGLIKGDSITAIDGIPIQHFIGQVALALHSKVAVALTIIPRRLCCCQRRQSLCQVVDADGYITHKLKRCRTKKAWGVTLAWNHQTQSLIVATIACGHPASRSGIQKGDRIISINGQAIQYDAKAMAMGGQQLSPETTDKTIEVKIQRRSNWARVSSQNVSAPPSYIDDATTYKSNQQLAPTSTKGLPMHHSEEDRRITAIVPPAYS